MELSKEESKKIELIYREQYLILLNYAKSALHNTSLAEEAVQDAFRIACSNPNKFLTSPNPPGWIFITLTNVIKKIRACQAKNYKLILKIMENPERFIVSNDFSSSIEADCSDLLTRDEFNLFKMIDIERNSIADAAKAYKISIEACKKRIQCIRKKLRKLFL